MPNPPTPGQVAYEAYWRVHMHDGLWHLPPAYATLQPITQQSWEAAAQAVRALHLTDQAAQMHHLIDYVVEHAPQASLDKVHIWLTDLSGIVQQEYHAAPQEDDHA